MKITKYIFSNRTEWRNEKKLFHRLDGPAIEYASGDKRWYQNGELHREDGPAVEWANGAKHWYQNGNLHRLNGPAVIWANGDKSWYFNGKFNRFVSEVALTINLKNKDPKSFILNSISNLDESEIFLLRLTIANHFSEHLNFLEKSLTLI